MSRVGGKRRETFTSIVFLGGTEFYDSKIEICKINYCENKVKLNNKDNSEIILMKFRRGKELFYILEGRSVKKGGDNKF